MTDIVKRLRDAWGDCHCGTAPLLEAADKIEQLVKPYTEIVCLQARMDMLYADNERLRAENAELQKQKDYWQKLAISRALEPKT